MKALVALTLAFASVLLPSSAPAQGDAPRRWVRLLTTQGETVDLDTTTVGRRDGLFVVWLRWDFDRHGPDSGAEYVEEIEVDCRAQRERVLSARRVGRWRHPSVLLGDSEMSNSIPLDSMDAQWRTYSKGSLGAQSVRELCRRLTSA